MNLTILNSIAIILIAIAVIMINITILNQKEEKIECLAFRDENGDIEVTIGENSNGDLGIQFPINHLLRK